MGQAKKRGTFEERKERALQEGRTKQSHPSHNVTERRILEEVIPAFDPTIGAVAFSYVNAFNQQMRRSKNRTGWPGT